MQARFRLLALSFSLAAGCFANTPVTAEDRILTGHKGEVTAVAFHPDGKLLATTSIDGTLRYWDLAAAKLVKSVDAHKGGVYAAAFTPDRKQLATCGADGEVRIWDLDGRELRHFNTRHGKVATLAISRDGSLLATGGYDGMIRLWDMAGGNEKRSIKIYSKAGIVTSLAISPNGKTIVSGGSTEDPITIGSSLYSHSGADVVRLWNIADGKLIRKFDQPAAHVAFSPDGKLIAAGAHVNEVEKTKRGFAINGAERFVLMDLDGHERLRKRLHGEGVAFSPDGKWLITGSGSFRHESEFGFVSAPGYREDRDELRLWDAATGREVLYALEDRSTAFAISPDGKILVSGDRDGKVTLRDITAARRTPFPEWPRPAVPPKYAKFCEELDARFEELLKKEKNPQPLRDADRKFRRTDPNSGKNCWYSTDAIRILRQTRSPAAVPLLVRYVMTLGQLERYSFELSNCLSMLTGLEPPAYGGDAVVQWWAKYKDQIETDLSKMPLERLRFLAERLVHTADNYYSYELVSKDPEGDQILYRARRILNWAPDVLSPWYPQDLHRRMLDIFLAKPVIAKKPLPGTSKNELEAMLERVPLLADLASHDPDCIQKAADDHQQNIDSRLACLLALQMAEKDQTKALLAILHDEKNTSRRIVIALGLARAGKFAVPDLIKLLDEPDPYLRMAAVKALAIHHPAEALPKAKQLLGDPKSKYFMPDLYRLIASIGNREAKETLAKALRAELTGDSKSRLIFDALMAFEHATDKKWMEAGPHPDSYYRDMALRALQWWDRENSKP